MLGDKSGLLEKNELADFLESTKNNIEKQFKIRAVLVSSDNRASPFNLPLSGKMRIKIDFKPEFDEDLDRATSPQELQQLLSLVSKTDDRAAALELALGHISLQVETGREVVKVLLEELGDIVKVLAKASPSPNINPPTQGNIVGSSSMN